MKVVFLGSKKMGFKCLNKMYSLKPDSIKAVITLNDKNDTRSVLNDFISFCSKSNINLNIVNKRVEADDLIKKFKPDLCIVIGWYWLIKNDILNLVRNGFIGIHNSLLPKYRGGSPCVWAMINGEKKIGISLFTFTNEMDAGGIWTQEFTMINDNDYIGDVLNRLESKAKDIIKKCYLQIINGSMKPKPQDHNLATFCSQRLPEDGLINWNKKAKYIYNFIRSQSEPYPGAFTFLQDEKLTIWRAKYIDNLIYYGTAGQVVQMNSNGVYVICGDNKPIILDTVGFKNKKYSANEIIKSVKIRF